MAAVIVSLDSLALGMPGISPIFGAALAEAAVVSFQSHSHASGVQMAVAGDFTSQCVVEWAALVDDAQSARTWGDPEEATEHGAYGVAALLVHALTEWTVVERARKGSGFDYWLAPKNSQVDLFQGLARLEISGIAGGTDGEIQRRAELKVKQISRSAGMNKPGIVAVIEFGTPLSKMVNA